jgi:hypothetical protein
MSQNLRTTTAMRLGSQGQDVAWDSGGSAAPSRGVPAQDGIEISFDREGRPRTRVVRLSATAAPVAPAVVFPSSRARPAG